MTPDYELESAIKTILKKLTEPADPFTLTTPQQLNAINGTLSGINNSLSNISGTLSLLSSNIDQCANALGTLARIAGDYSEQTLGKTALQVLRTDYERVSKEYKELRAALSTLHYGAKAEPLKSDGQT
jgi:ABC-type transporter Mla subunit MlaD